MSTTEQKIEIMQAYVDGKAIQYKDRCAYEWHIMEQEEWDWCFFEYRIKPEPKTEMMQMWQNKRTKIPRAHPVILPPSRGEWLKVGEPFEFTYPEES